MSYPFTIVFEGPDGAGKSTLLESFAELLLSKGYRVHLTREPGGTPVGEALRSLLKERLQPVSELFLHLAIRLEHLHAWKALKGPQIILCDRFMDSTYVYQCLMGGIAKEFVDFVSAPILRGFVPDLTFVLKTEESERQRRLAKRGFLTLWDKAPLAGLYDQIQEWPYPCGTIPQRVVVTEEMAKEDLYRYFQNARQNSEVP